MSTNAIAMPRAEEPATQPRTRALLADGEWLDRALARRFALLSERELEIVRLMAAGMSNAQIAGELYLSEGTVKTYVTRTLNKLRLRTRVQVVVAAFDAGVVRPGEGRRV